MTGQEQRIIRWARAWAQAKLHALAIRDDPHVPFGDLRRANAARALLSAEEELLQAVEMAG